MIGYAVVFKGLDNKHYAVAQFVIKEEAEQFCKTQNLTNGIGADGKETYSVRTVAIDPDRWIFIC